MNNVCRDCMLDKHLNRYPEGTPEETVKEYQDAVRKLVDQPGAVPTGPEVFYEIKAVRKRLFGEGEMDYTQIKRHYNALMMENQPELEQRVQAAEDPLMNAVQYAMMGNFIDFAALDNVTEDKLKELIDRAPDIVVDPDCLAMLRVQAAKARTLVLLTDNCGEIVMDKILLRQIRRINPDIEITVIVRGAPVANDATMEDMEQIGMAELGRCMGNGTATDGTVLRNLSREARETIMNADMVIAKGQANYETLYGCGCNIFYIFMCKCMLFMDRFKVPKFYGVLTHEEPEILFGVYGDEALLKRFQFRQILPEEADQAVEIENICFPPNEACPESEMRRRVAMIPNQFLVAVDRETGKLAGYVNGLCSDEKELRDDFFTDVTLHDPAAQTDFIAGLDVLPAYRGQGLAKELMRLYCIWGQVKGMHRVVLTAHEEKVGMYERMGFKDLGIASSVWGGGVWHEMEHRLER